MKLITIKKSFVIYAAVICTIPPMLFGIFAARTGMTHALTALPHIPVFCPANVKSILVIGQSQASNTGEGRRIPQKNNAAYAFAGGWCYRLRDPIPGTAGRNGSIWPSFADRLDQPVLITNISISGSAIEEWTNSASINRIRDTLDSLKSAGYNDSVILLMQGETNGIRQTTARKYLAHLNTLFSIAPNNRWIITRESICYDHQKKWKPLDEARDNISYNHKNITIGPDLDEISLSMRKSDRCHFTAAGQDVIANRLVETLKSINF